MTSFYKELNHVETHHRRFGGFLPSSSRFGLCRIARSFKLGDIEEAEQWEERAWYQREDGGDWRVQDDGSVIVTISATGDVTIGGDTRKSGKSIFDKQLAQEELGLDFPLSNVKSIFEADDMTLINFEGTLTNTKSATKTPTLRRAAGICAGADLFERGGRQSGK